MSADWLRWEGRSTVYRCFEPTGLLYVGCSMNLPQRIRTHQVKSFWWPSCARVVVRLFPDVNSAHAAELAAIRTESPRFNIVGRRLSWEADEIRDLMLAIRQGANPQLPFNLKRLANLQQRLDFLERTR